MSIEVNEKSHPIITEEHFKMIADKIQKNIPQIEQLISSAKNTIDKNVLSENYKKFTINKTTKHNDSVQHVGRPATFEEFDDFFKTMDDIESKVKPKFKRPKLPMSNAAAKSKTASDRLKGSSGADDTILFATTFCGFSPADNTLVGQNFNETNLPENLSFTGATNGSLTDNRVQLAEKIESFQNSSTDIENIADTMERDRKMFDTLKMNVEEMKNLFASLEKVMANKKETNDNCFITKEFLDKLTLTNEVNYFI